MLKSWLTRKVILAIAGVIINLLATKLKLTPEQVEWINKMILGWIGVEGAADVVSRFKKPAEPVEEPAVAASKAASEKGGH